MSADELRSALASSVLAPSTLVWRDGMESWVPASSVPELGLSGGEPLAEPSTTDIGLPAGMRDDSSLMAAPGAPAGLVAGIPPPPALVARASHPEDGSRADTGRPTPTELLQSGASRGASSGSASPAPRPAAGRAPDLGSSFKIGAAPAPRPAAGSPVRSPGKVESSTSSKIGGSGASGWRRPQIGKTKNDEDVTLVAEALEPFKLKPLGDTTTHAATPSPARSAASGGREASRVGPSPVARRPVTRTALLEMDQAGKPASQPPRPAIGARPASVPPPPYRRPSSAPPPAVVPRPPSTTPPPPRGGLRSTAVMGSSARAGSGMVAPAAPRLPNLAKPNFAIVENTSTDSTGVLPLSGKYAAEPPAEERAPSPSYVDGAPPFAQRTPSFADAAARPGNGARDPLPSDAHLHGSYPPVPSPTAAMGTAAPRVEAQLHAAPHDGSAQRAPLHSNPPPAASGYGATPSPYSAPPPPLALGHPMAPHFGGAAAGLGSEPPPAPGPGELKATGALPLVNPKRAYPPPPEQDMFDAPTTALPQKSGGPVVVPLSSLFGAGGVLIAMAISAFFVGRCSVAPGPSAPPARAVLATLPQLARAGIPSPPKPCWMAKQPVRWAPSVLQSVPVDVAPTSAGVVVAYARDSQEPATVEVDFGTGTFEDKAADKVESDIVRVAAPRDGGKLLVTTKADSGPLAPYTYVAGASPFLLGVDGRGTASPSVAVADEPSATPATLWSIPQIEEDKGLEAARILTYAPNKHALVFRRAGNILGGFIGEGRKAEGAIGVIAGSGGSVGKPSLGTNQREIAVIFGDKATPDGAWEIRVGHAPLGEMPRETAVVPLPQGGPGGDAFAPDIAGTPDGRWVIVWTEGKTGGYAVRAQTFGPDLKPLGDPIAISPPAGNFGQAVVGVAGGYVTTMFLSRGTTGSYELWGAVLKCGS